MGYESAVLINIIIFLIVVREPKHCGAIRLTVSPRKRNIGKDLFQPFICHLVYCFDHPVQKWGYALTSVEHLCAFDVNVIDNNTECTAQYAHQNGESGFGALFIDQGAATVQSGSQFQ